MTDAKSTVTAFLDAVNRQDWSTVADLTTPDIRRHQGGGAPTMRTRSQLISFLQVEAKAFPDAHERINFLVEENDRVAAHLTFRGTQSGPMGSLPPSHRTYEADFICIFRVVGGRIAESWVAWDGLHMLQSLGHLAPTEGRGDQRAAEQGDEADER